MRGGSGSLNLFSYDGGEVALDVGQIQKQGSRAIDISMTLFPSNAIPLNLSVAGGAVIRNLNINMADTSRPDAGGTATFNGDLTVEGAAEIKAGNRSGTAANAQVDATLTLKGAENKFAQDITLDDNDTSPDRGRAYLVISGSVDQTIGRVANNGTNRIKAASDGDGTRLIYVYVFIGYFFCANRK